MKDSVIKANNSHHKAVEFNNNERRDAWFDDLNHLEKFTDNRGHSLTRIGKTDTYKTSDGQTAKLEKFDLKNDVTYIDTNGIITDISWYGFETKHYSSFDTDIIKNVHKTLLAKIDKNKDKSLSIGELKTALEDTSITGYPAQLLYSMNKNFFEYAALHNGKDKNAVISSKDIDELDGCIKALKSDPLLSKAVNLSENIPLSGLITSKVPALKHELDKAVTVKNIEDELSWSSLKFQMKSDLNKGAFGQIKLKYAIVPKACQQSEMGDCAIVSSMAAIAKNNPESIHKMIKENKDGSFDVTLPIEPKNPYHVTLSDVEEVIYEVAGDEGKWPAIIKKAYGMRRVKLEKNTHLSQDNVPGWLEVIKPGTKQQHQLEDEASCPADHIGNGNFPEHVIHALTGKPTNSQWVGHTELADLDKKLTEIVANKIPAVAGTNLVILQNPFVESKFPDLFPAHAYTVMGYDSKHKMVELRNPYGHGQKDWDNGGQFKMPLDEFKDKFMILSYTTEKQEWNFDATVALASVVAKFLDTLEENQKKNEKK